jgi:hypothetical protein
MTRLIGGWRLLLALMNIGVVASVVPAPQHYELPAALSVASLAARKTTFKKTTTAASREVRNAHRELRSFRALQQGGKYRLL